MVSTLVLIYFGRLSLDHTLKSNFITSQIADLQVSSILIKKQFGICSILIIKPFGTIFTTKFCVWFFKKHISCYILLTDQI